MDIAKIAGLDPRPIIHDSDLLVVSDRNCGVEIEIENVSRRHLTDTIGGHWDVTTDHSLRPADNSAEIRSLRGGACGKALINALMAYDAVSLGKSTLPHFSWRTGLHVHVDVRDKCPADIRVLSTHYALLEPYIFNWAGAGRWESRFSMPWWVVAQDVEQIFVMSGKVLTSTRDNPFPEVQFSQAVNRFSKYTSLNLAPMMRLGTVEFRHGQSTKDVKKVIDYINICLAIVEASTATADPDQCAKLVEDYTLHGPESYMRKHFHSVIPELLYSPLRGEPPLTRAIITASMETALQIAELGIKERGAATLLNNIDTIETILSNKNPVARRTRRVAFPTPL